MKSEESSAIKRILEAMLLVRPLIYTIKSRGLGLIPAVHQHVTFSNWIRFHLKQLSDTYFVDNFQRLPDTPLHFSLYTKPSCHTLSNALEISKNTARVLSYFSKDS